MQSHQLKPYLFVVVQFACLGYIALTGPLIARQPAWLAVEVLALLLGLWTVWTMRTTRFGVLPDITQGAQLVMHGPYRFIRHPMYATLLLGSVALVLNAFTPLRLIVWFVLLVHLTLKLQYEERKLAQHFPAYAEYQRQTKRLVPLLY